MDILIDFDGTCVTHSYPEIGEDIGAQYVLKKLVNAGHRLILFTMRCDGMKKQYVENYQFHEGDYLTDAVNWFKKNNIPLYGIQTNPTQHKWTTSPKAHGHLIIDDICLGIPLLHDKELSEFPFVDWAEVDQMLLHKGLYD